MDVERFYDGNSSAEIIGKLILEELKCIRKDMKEEIRQLKEAFFRLPKQNNENDTEFNVVDIDNPFIYSIPGNDAIVNETSDESLEEMPDIKHECDRDVVDHDTDISNFKSHEYAPFPTVVTESEFSLNNFLLSTPSAGRHDQIDHSQSDEMHGDGDLDNDMDDAKLQPTNSARDLKSLQISKRISEIYDYAFSDEKNSESQNEDKLNNCRICGKTFLQKYNLITHMRIHTGERPFQCEICKKTFSQNGHLTTHMRIHTGEKRFKCSFCGKRFVQKCHLDRHVKTHKSVNQMFNCEVCRCSFKKEQDLNRHIKMQHGLIRDSHDRIE